jgi:RNA polymerase-binding transcription factor
MSELTQSQLQELKKQLESRHEVLRREVQEELDQAAVDNATLQNEFDKTDSDAASAGADADFNLAMMSRDLVEVREIESALDRFAQGTYGECIDCGRSIGFERLHAYPTAVRCIACQSRFELTHGNGVPRTL